MDIFGFLAFMTALWLINTLTVGKLFAAIFAGGVSLLVKFVIWYASTHFYPGHANGASIMHMSDVATAVLQCGVAWLIFWWLERGDDSLTNYIVAIFAGGIIGCIFVPSIMSRLFL